MAERDTCKIPPAAPPTPIRKESGGGVEGSEITRAAKPGRDSHGNKCGKGKHTAAARGTGGKRRDRRGEWHLGEERQRIGVQPAARGAGPTPNPIPALAHTYKCLVRAPMRTGGHKTTPSPSPTTPIATTATTQMDRDKAATTMGD